jgi:uncharacterized protein YegL
MKKNLHDLFANAKQAGTLGSHSASLLSGDLGAVVVAGAAGVDAEDIVATDVTLFTLLVDSSSSIASRGLEDAVRKGQNQLVDALYHSKEVDKILVALWSFDDKERVVHSYVPVEDAVRLDASNYSGRGCTKLYDTWCNALAANVAYAERLRASGTPVRSIVVVITDGEDVGSKRRVSDCAVLTKDLLASEQFVLAFVGVGADVDFHQVAAQMGLGADSVLVQKNATDAALRKAFHMVSQSAVRVSASWVKPGAQTGFFAP